MVLSQIHYHRHQHGESLIFVGLQDVQEVIVFKEAHGSVGHLQMDAADALDDPFEQFGDQGVDFVHFAHLQHFL